MPQGAKSKLGEIFGATHINATPWGTRPDLTDVGKDGAVMCAKTQPLACAAEDPRVQTLPR